MELNDIKSLFPFEVEMADNIIFHDLEEDIDITQEDFDNLDKLFGYIENATTYNNLVDFFEKDFGVKYVDGVLDLGSLLKVFWILFNMNSLVSYKLSKDFFCTFVSDKSLQKTYMTQINFKEMITNVKMRKGLISENSKYFTTIFGDRNLSIVSDS